MATDTDEKTTGGASGINYSVADCDNLLAKFDQGEIIYAADMQTLAELFNDFLSHNHDVTDILQKDTFGNTGGDQTVTNDETTSLTKDIIALNDTINRAGTPITAGFHDLLRGRLNSLRTHDHDFDDGTTSGATEDPEFPNDFNVGDGEIP